MNPQRNNLVLALVALGAVALTGCPDSTTQTVAILAPANGATFTVDDDVSDAISGVQIDVTVRLTGFSSGSTVDLRVNDESVGGLTYRGSDVVFSEVTLEPGENVLRAVAGSTSAQVAVTLVGGGCPSLQFTRPTASARINGSDDADGNAANGFQYDVRLTSDAATGTTVALFVAGEAVGTATVADGAVEFTGVTLLATMPAPGAAVNVTLRAQTGAECAATITVQVLGPAVACATFAFVDPTDGEVFGITDDENGDPTDGFQKTVSISTDAPVGTAVELLVNGGAVASTTVTGTVLRFAAVDLPDGSLVLRIQYEEDAACGEEIGVTVETGAPSCDIVAPLGDYLNAADDVDTATPGLQTDFDVASDAEAGQPVRLIIDGVETGAPTASIAAGHALFREIGLSEGAHTVRARCENAVGNVGFSASFSYMVDTVVPTCAITSPADGAWFNDGDDALATVLGTQVEVAVQVTDVPTATTVAQCGFAPLDPEGTVTPGVTGAGSGYVTLTGPGNAVCCAVQDAAGNAGEGRVTLNLDTEVPQLQIRRPDAATTLILAVDDEGPSDTFCQYTVNVGCSNVGQPVTLSINTIDHSRTETCTASADALGGTATWSAITIPQGSVTLQARGESIGGLLGTSPEKVVTVDTEPPVLSVTFPACGIVLTPADDNDAAAPGIQYRVSVFSNTSPVTLNVTDAGGTAISGSPYNLSIAPPAAAVFPNVTIVPSGSTFGTAYLRASAVDSNGQVGLSIPNPCTIEVRDVPRVTITSPTTGALLGAADDCNTSRAGFDLGVTVSTNITAGNVELFVAGTSAGTLAYTGTPVTFCVPAADGANILVRAEGTDGRGTGSAEIRVTIDSLPPDTPVTDLDVTVFNRRGGELNLAWTAPADAGGGSVTGYRIRCATSATTPVAFNWDTATNYSFTGVAGAPGTAQTQRLVGFRIERYVACMVRPVDAVGSLGPLGNTDEVHLEFLHHEILGPSSPLSQLGGDLEACGDVNGDGRADFIVGGRAADTAFIVFGRSGSLPASPDVQLTGPAGSSFGRSVAGIGDFNGDTMADVAIGAFGLNANKGGAYVYYGRTSWPPLLSVADADVTLLMDDPAGTADDGAVMGAEVGPAGDYDGDGLMDVLVSAYSWNAAQGAVLLLFGRSIAAGTALTVPGDYTTGFAGDLWLLGTTADGQLGVGTAAAYRLNGDSYDDIVLGAPGGSSGGRVVISYGRARSATTALRTLSTFESQLNSPRTGTNIRFGAKVAMADLGGDGTLDLLVHLVQHPGTTGAYGGVLGYRNDGTGAFPSAAVLSIENDVAGNTNDFFGNSIAGGAFLRSVGLARMDGDTLPELLFGANAYGTEGGAGVFYWGSSFPATVAVTAADMVVRCPSGDTTSRSSVAYVGDVTGDGFSDMAVSHTQASGGRGRVMVLY